MARSLHIHLVDRLQIKIQNAVTSITQFLHKSGERKSVNAFADASAGRSIPILRR